MQQSSVLKLYGNFRVLKVLISSKNCDGIYHTFGNGKKWTWKEMIHRGPWREEVQMCKDYIHGRGLHSSTFWLKVSAFCRIGGMLRGCSGGV